jgi:hypothetical protein
MKYFSDIRNSTAEISAHIKNHSRKILIISFTILFALPVLGIETAQGQSALLFSSPPQKTADVGRYSVTVEVPKDFNPQSVKFVWSAKSIRLAKPDGTSTNSILDNIDLYAKLNESELQDGLDGLVKISILDKGRKATFSFASIIGARVSTVLEAEEDDGGNGLSIKVPLQFTFLPNPSPENLVANIPQPDNISIEVNNPDPGKATTTTVSVRVSDSSPTDMAIDASSYKIQRSYWVMRVNKEGSPLSPLAKITPTGGAPVWAKFQVSQDTYKTSGLYFRVIFGQVFPQLDRIKSNDLFYTVCPNCRAPYWSYFFKDFNFDIPFKQSATSKIGFQWSTGDFSDLTATWKNPTETIVNDNGIPAYNRFYFRFQRDVSKFPAEAVCEKTIVDLQYKKGSNWISVWTDKSFGYSGAPSNAREAGGYKYLNCLDYTKNDNGLTLESSVSQQYMNINDIMPYPSPDLPVGAYSFRFVLKNQYLDSSEEPIGSIYEDSVTPFSVKYINTPDAPKLNVKVSYPAQTLQGKRYLASVVTSSKASGKCNYYLFNRVRISVGSASLKNGKSSLSVTAMSANVGTGRASSLTVVCTSGKMTGTGFATFYVLSKG